MQQPKSVSASIRRRIEITAVDFFVCGTAIDGEWSAWTSWSECEGTYGKNGTKERRRSCTNPAPAKGGMDCTGDSIETSTCSPMTCEGGKVFL